MVRCAMQHFSRRQFLQFGLCAATSMALPRLAWGAAQTKELAFYNLHTGESLKAIFAENGRYVPSAMAALSHVLRDYRTGDVYPMDPLLFEQLHSLQALVGKSSAFHVISGYRSPKTNQMLHTNSDGVASRSLHLEGRAIDIRLPGKDLSLLHAAALSMRAGGVGYYPSSDFIHLDTGRVRCWG